MRARRARGRSHPLRLRGLLLGGAASRLSLSISLSLSLCRLSLSAAARSCFTCATYAIAPARRHSESL